MLIARSYLVNVGFSLVKIFVKVLFSLLLHLLLLLLLLLPFLHLLPLPLLYKNLVHLELR